MAEPVSVQKIVAGLNAPPFEKKLSLVRQERATASCLAFGNRRPQPLVPVLGRALPLRVPSTGDV